LLADLEADSPWKKEASVAPALRLLVENRGGKPLYAELLQAAASYPELMKDVLMQQRILESLKDRSIEVRRAALQILLNRFLADPELAPLAQKAISGFDTALRGLLLSELSAPRQATYKGRAASATGLDVAFLRLEDIKHGKDLLADPIVLRAVADSLKDRDGNVRAAALDLVVKRKEVLSQPEIA